MGDAFSQAMEEAGAAVIVTGTTISLGTLVWLIHPHEFQRSNGGAKAEAFESLERASPEPTVALAVIFTFLSKWLKTMYFNAMVWTCIASFPSVFRTPSSAQR